MLRYVALIGVGVALLLAAVQTASADSPPQGKRDYYVAAGAKGKDPKVSLALEDGDLKLAYLSTDLRCHTRDGIKTEEFLSGFGPARLVGGKFLDRHRSRFIRSVMAGHLRGETISGRARLMIKGRKFPAHPELQLPSCDSGRLRFEASKVSYGEWRDYNAGFGVTPDPPGAHG